MTAAWPSSKIDAQRLGYWHCCGTPVVSCTRQALFIVEGVSVDVSLAACAEHVGEVLAEGPVLWPPYIEWIGSDERRNNWADGEHTPGSLEEFDAAVEDYIVEMLLDDYPDELLRLPCEHCHASPGELCQTSVGRVRSPHATRHIGSTPGMLAARFASRCPECRRHINSGDPIYPVDQVSDEARQQSKYRCHRCAVGSTLPPFGPLSTECPNCSAAFGEQCLSPTTGKPSSIHIERTESRAT